MQNLIMKQELNSQDLHLLATEMDKKKKSTGVSWLLLLFLGGFGGHRYYLGRIGTAIAMTLTLGGLGFWSLIDLFLISGMIRRTNEKIEREIIADINLLKNARNNPISTVAI